jgi:hypothetical protein
LSKSVIPKTGEDKVDNLELRNWLELRKKEIRNLREIKGDLDELGVRRELIIAMAEKFKMDEMPTLRENAVYGFSRRIKSEVFDIEDKINELDKNIQKNEPITKYIEEKIKLIEKKLGPDIREKLRRYEEEFILKDAVRF